MFLVPQRKPTTLPRGTILILMLAAGGIAVVTASRGSAVGMGWRQEMSVIQASVSESQQVGSEWAHRSRGHSAEDSSSS